MTASVINSRLLPGNLLGMHAAIARRARWEGPRRVRCGMCGRLSSTGHQPAIYTRCWSCGDEYIYDGDLGEDFEAAYERHLDGEYHRAYPDAAWADALCHNCQEVPARDGEMLCTACDRIIYGTEAGPQ